MNKEIRKFIDGFGVIGYESNEYSLEHSMQKFTSHLCEKYSITEYTAGKIIDISFNPDNFNCSEFIFLVNYEIKKYIENMNQEEKEAREKILRSKMSLEDRLFEIEKKLGIV